MTQQSVEPRTVADDAGAGTRVPAGRSWLDRYFHISQRGSTVAREVRGGVTTFMAMAYILLLNPLILSGKDAAGHTLGQNALITATAFAAAFSTLLMGFFGKVPLALAAGLSVSGVLSSQVAPQMTWPQAMGMCVIYGVVIMLLVVTGLREMIMNAIPLALKHAITMGIGLFVALIGFYKAGFVHQGKSTPVTLGPAGELAGWPVLLFAATLLAIFMLQARGIPGAILIGIVGGTVLAVVLNALGVIAPKQWASGAPELHGSAVSMPDFSLFGKVEFGGWGDVGVMTVGMIVFTLVLAGFFDAMATIIGVGTEAGLADAQGRMPGLSKALFIDGAGGAVGGVAGASGQTVFVESATGVGEGARTGLSSVVTGLFFAACLFFTPLTAIVPGEVAAAALVVIGAMMMMNARHVDWADRATAIPVFLTVVVMPFTYSITAGVAAGVLSYVAIKIAQGKAREIGAFMWGLAAIFLVFFALNPIESWMGVH
ncbi:MULTISPECIES: NCS2 family permease [Streptomyces]|jgi:AGZA family xanthine/uracil permease-like MFS transporter|uniref:MFS transporter n=1 Tax=Streptomyces olivochromogenes TaxID=1963 RepID=A0A250VP32_STROL|nr:MULTISPECIES: NCS2 family permease [Streptomyces]KAF5993946.1 NCS2 family permease [Streptomyces sp. WAC00263]KUN43433.1 MFS transporter [Streptomyces olivochromogenes]MCT9110948.1 NCS2 family permease [Streptomyces mirabilis]SOE31365.1 putative MFS transporter, AGZA family, xanthine/uracil permease [Streptomyces sp. OK228]GAX55802.1 MFS transporter [Streptomyces olivochromogenes]